MPEHHREAEPSNLNLSSILLAIFKRKKIILISTAAGAIAAAAVFHFWPRSYESDATLLVRYVLDRSAVDPESRDGSSVGSVATRTTDTFINAEVSILQSWDLAVQVAEALGPKRVFPDAKGDPSINDAAGAIYSGLKVGTTKNSNVIQVSYTNSRPGVAVLVLNELVNRYFTKHLEVHRSAGAFDFVSQQTDQVRSRLNQTEDALKAWTNALNIAHDQIEREGVYLHFARVKLHAGRFEEARAHLKAVSDPMYTVLKERLARNIVEKEAAKQTNAPPRAPEGK